MDASLALAPTQTALFLTFYSSKAWVEGEPLVYVHDGSGTLHLDESVVGLRDVRVWTADVGEVLAERTAFTIIPQNWSGPASLVVRLDGISHRIVHMDGLIEYSDRSAERFVITPEHYSVAELREVASAETESAHAQSVNGRIDHSSGASWYGNSPCVSVDWVHTARYAVGCDTHMFYSELITCAGRDFEYGQYGDGTDGDSSVYCGYAYHDSGRRALYVSGDGATVIMANRCYAPPPSQVTPSAPVPAVLRLRELVRGAGATGYAQMSIKLQGFVSSACSGSSPYYVDLERPVWFCQSLPEAFGCGRSDVVLPDLLVPAAMSPGSAVVPQVTTTVIHGGSFWWGGSGRPASPPRNQGDDPEFETMRQDGGAFIDAQTLEFAVETYWKFGTLPEEMP